MQLDKSLKGVALYPKKKNACLRCMIMVKYMFMFINVPKGLLKNVSYVLWRFEKKY
jgi:hypothetical protein